MNFQLLSRIAGAPPRRARRLLQALETRRFYLTALYNEVFGRFARARRMRARFLILVTNQGCNLRCRDCGTLTPYLAREHLPGFLPPAVLADDVDTLATVLHVRTIQL